MQKIKVNKFGKSKVQHSWRIVGIDFSETNRLIEEIKELLRR